MVVATAYSGVARNLSNAAIVVEVVAKRITKSLVFMPIIPVGRSVGENAMPLTLLEQRIVKAERHGEAWAELHAKWLQLDEDKKSFLAALINDLDDGSMSEAKLERLARGSKAYRDYIAGLAIAKGEELRAKVRYENARDLFEAARSAESTERQKMQTLRYIP